MTFMTIGRQLSSLVFNAKHRCSFSQSGDLRPNPRSAGRSKVSLPPQRTNSAQASLRHPRRQAQVQQLLRRTELPQRARPAIPLLPGRLHSAVSSRTGSTRTMKRRTPIKRTGRGPRRTRGRRTKTSKTPGSGTGMIYTIPLCRTTTRITKAVKSSIERSETGKRGCIINS